MMEQAWPHSSCAGADRARAALPGPTLIPVSQPHQKCDNARDGHHLTTTTTISTLMVKYLRSVVLCCQARALEIV